MSVGSARRMRSMALNVRDSVACINAIESMRRIDNLDGSLEAVVDTDQLAAFLRVVRESSFTRAALSLGIGQPAVSARIHALEAAIGGPLFTRGRKIGLTLLGEGFLPYARRATE